jgi:hypothetical protein
MVFGETIYSYDFNKGLFYLKLPNGPASDFAIRKPRVIIRGDSGVGKTYLCNALIKLNLVMYSTSVKKYPAIVINFYNAPEIWKRTLEVEGKLVIIDDFDFIMRKSDVFSLDDVLSDTRNDYIICARGMHDFKVFPDNAARLHNICNVITLKYIATSRKWT